MKDLASNASILRRRSLLILVLASAYIFLILLKPLADPDLWWHLRTGQWIVEEKTLPGPEEPFSYTTPKPLSKEELAGLRSQWLGEVVFYMAFYIFGYAGVAALRAALAFLPFAIIYYLRIRQTKNPLQLLSVLVFPLLFIALKMHYTYERPQAFSYLLMLVVIVILFHKRTTTKLLFLPPVMALWANLHGGYIVGIAIIVVTVVAETLHYIVQRLAFRASASSKSPLIFVAFCGLSIFASGLNPGGYHLLSTLWGLPAQVFSAQAVPGAFVPAEVLEYKSLWYFYRQYHYIWVLLPMAYMALGFLALVSDSVSQRKIDFSLWAVLLSIWAFGLLYSKGLNFSLIASAYAISRGSWPRLKGLLLPALSLALSAGLILNIWQTARWQLSPKLPSSWVNEGLYPEGSVNFIKEHNLKGLMFNDMRWGGYLIWRLYPTYKVFYDSRSVNEKMFGIYLTVSRGYKEWQETLNAFNVNFVLVPVLSKESGLANLLALRIMIDAPEDWRLVYLGYNEAVFVRNNAQNEEVINCCALPEKVFWGRMLSLSEELLETAPEHPEAKLSKAFSLYGLGRYEEAELIVKTLPESPIRQWLLEKLMSQR